MRNNNSFGFETQVSKHLSNLKSIWSPVPDARTVFSTNASAHSTVNTPVEVVEIEWPCTSIDTCQATIEVLDWHGRDILFIVNSNISLLSNILSKSRRWFVEGWCCQGFFTIQKTCPKLAPEGYTTSLMEFTQISEFSLVLTLLHTYQQWMEEKHIAHYFNSMSTRTGLTNSSSTRLNQLVWNHSGKNMPGHSNDSSSRSQGSCAGLLWGAGFEGDSYCPFSSLIFYFLHSAKQSLTCGYPSWNGDVSALVVVVPTVVGPDPALVVVRKLVDVDIAARCWTEQWLFALQWWLVDTISRKLIFLLKLTYWLSVWMFHIRNRETELEQAR